MTMNHIETDFRELKLDDFPKGKVSSCWIHLINSGIGSPIRVPVVVARGTTPGKVLGLTAAVHGDELNGIAVLQELFGFLEPKSLVGDVVGVLAVNVPGVLAGTRKFNNGVDLNTISPGKPDGTESDVFINRVINRIVNRFDYLIDLHTASRGRVNSYYIRADMTNPMSATLARLQNADIILSNVPSDGTLRGNAAKDGIAAITAELRDPGVFQDDVTQGALVGIKNVLYHLGFLEGMVSCPVGSTPVCGRSRWLYTDQGGILKVDVKTREQVKKNQNIATVRTIFGEITASYKAPEDGLIIGHSINPINQTGSRIIHLGADVTYLPCITEDK